MLPATAGILNLVLSAILDLCLDVQHKWTQMDAQYKLTKQFFNGFKLIFQIATFVLLMVVIVNVHIQVLCWLFGLTSPCVSPVLRIIRYLFSPNSSFVWFLRWCLCCGGKLMVKIMKGFVLFWRRFLWFLGIVMIVKALFKAKQEYFSNI